MQTAHIVNRKIHCVLDVLGPTVEFLASPEESDAVYCVMIGTIPAGAVVPLHSHPDMESFFILSGAVEMLPYQGLDSKWCHANAGDFIHIPSHAKHAFRNDSDEAMCSLITTTPQLGRFFHELGRPATPGARPYPATPDDLDRFARIAARYNHWLGSPAENPAMGIFF